MPLKLGLDIDVRALLAKLDDLGKKQLPFATALALTRTAQAAGKAVQEAMPNVFDNPTPYTIKAVRVIPATKARLYSDVLIKDEAPKGTPPSKYLEPEIEGGQRRQKRSERALTFRGLMIPGQVAIPTSNAKLDQYGNLPGSQWNRILSAVGGQVDTAQNQTAKSKRRNKKALDLFVVTGRKKINGHFLSPGIYERTPEGVRMLIAYSKRAVYRRRLPFFKLIEDVYSKQLTNEFNKALREAIASAKLAP